MIIIYIPYKKKKFVYFTISIAVIVLRSCIIKFAK